MHECRGTRLLGVWSVLIFVSVAVFTPQPAQANPLHQASSPLEVHLTVLRDQVVVGEAFQWLVTLAPHDGAAVSAVETSSPDASVWSLASQSLPVSKLSSGFVFTQTAIPLVPGELKPALQLSYIVSGTLWSVYVVADHSVHVIPVTDFVTVELLRQELPMSVGSVMPLSVRLQNDTPFELTEVYLKGEGTALTWPTSMMVGSVSSGNEVQYPITATVESETAQPVIHVTAKWKDNAGREQTADWTVAGNFLYASDSLLESIPENLFAIFLGVISSVITTFGTRLVEDYLKRQEEFQIQRKQLQGLLHWVLQQTSHAVEHGDAFADLSSLATVFQEKGLFDVAETYHLITPVRELWAAAVQYNEGLTLPNASQRIEEMRKTIQQLETQLCIMDKRTATHKRLNG